MPSCTDAVARKRWEGSAEFLTTNDYDKLISRDAIGTLDGETKFVFLKGVYDGAAEFYRAAAALPYSKSKRGAGQDLLFGTYYDPRNGPLGWTSDTRNNPEFLETKLMPLLVWMGAALGQLQLGPSGFSTVTVNRSALFTPHRDKKNKGLACMMAFGEFVGGDLCFPRLRVAFRLRPGDLLIADTANEYHGTVGGIWDDRISVVAYLR